MSEQEFIQQYMIHNLANYVGDLSFHSERWDLAADRAIEDAKGIYSH
jgi:hypothetical protein